MFLVVTRALSVLGLSRARVGTGLVGNERLAALEAECARLVPLGAVRVRLLRADGHNESCLVMQDIEGNEFCLD
jgi:glyoxalase superfamily protein